MGQFRIELSMDSWRVLKYRGMFVGWGCMKCTATNLMFPALAWDNKSAIFLRNPRVLLLRIRLLWGYFLD